MNSKGSQYLRPHVYATARDEAVPLLDREEEQSLLRSLLDEVAAHGQALVLRGEPGVGKSRLLSETAYGAGPGHVGAHDHWLGTVSDALYVETVPFAAYLARDGPLRGLLPFNIVTIDGVPATAKRRGRKTMADVVRDDLESFRGRFVGRVVTAEDEDFDAVRAECVWNGDIGRRPWVIAQATSAGDVADAVRLARESGREVGIGRPQGEIPSQTHRFSMCFTLRFPVPEGCRP